MPEIVLNVNGKAYAGWTSARVTRGIESIAGGFELTVSERWESGANPWPIYDGDACSVVINGTTVITGYVDRRRLSYSATEHSLSVSGRDKTGDIVDSSASAPWEYLKTATLTVVQRVAQQFGVTASYSGAFTPGPSPARITVDPGDAAFDVIDRVCRLAGLLPVSDGAGKIVLMRPGSLRAVTALVEGENILAASADFDSSGRFRTYRVLGQHAGRDDHAGESVATVKGEATDENVTRTGRVLVIRPEGNVTTRSAKDRAEWEATVRAARGDTVSVTVQGWTQGDGALWPVNALVTVQSPRLGVNGEMLITQVVYSVDEGGTTTQLTLRDPEAFRPEPTIAAGSGDNYWKEIRRGV
jgi:prophage tail gpP-like protein